MELRNLVLFLSFINIISARITVPIRKLSTLNSSSVPSSQSPHHKMDVNRTHHVVKERLYNFFNVQYFGNISVGTPEQISIVILDTGSNELWFSGSNCTNCKDEILFDCSASSTCTNTTTPGRIDYDQGSVLGTYASDLVSIDGSFCVRYPFILATQKANLNTEANGVMGLGNWPGYRNLVDLAYDNGAISDKVFSFYFDYVATPTHSLLSTESYLTLGYIHEKHAGDIVWLPITDRTSWTTDVIGMTVGSNNIDISSDPGSDKVLFDTGTSIMLIADPVYEAVINILESAGCFSPQTGALYRGGYICPCSEEQVKSYPEISLFTRGVEIILRSEAYLISAWENDEKGMCHVALRSNKWLGQDRVQILGDAYFRQNYVVFSKRNQTIGVTHKRNHLLTPVPDRLYVWTGIIGLGLGLLISLAILYIEWQNSKEEQLNPPKNKVKGEVELIE